MKKIKSVRPAMHQILVEMLSAKDAMNTILELNTSAEVGAPQGIILALGSEVKNTGLNVGDRVLLQGTYVPVPNYDNHYRIRGIVEIHDIKAILDQEN